ncbi:protease FtsH subunit HflC [Rhodoblastus acidophilus]|uniref:Protein HflC n=1 Tax=Rhodoblastus acidophilus TaxID=1074 RepID=A0A212RT55_RHOAC|nr:protease modulator HflC [Rhodoblastus acidophilus]PPQ40709.1 protease modulator HflC [Rhodoblastus acidophilus]RAI21913.1 protease modulator HflC [Rhodoblastus acidophilus]SNB75788.1 protease FtsH subunit HflC [Rhodoblastus acidophilus]
MRRIALFIGALALALVYAAFFEVRQTQQALILRFGEPAGLVTAPGLHVKWPWIESVVYIDNRILDLESPQQEVLASDNQRLEVEAFVRYRIADALRFYQTVGTVAGAGNQLASVLNSTVRRVLGDADQTRIVRDQRLELTAKIREQVDTEAKKFGLTVVDARIRRVDLPRQISEKVFDRMRTERAREAAEYRAFGQQEAAQINASAQRDATVIVAEARQKAETLRGDGDAERAKIFADAFGQDADFFAFYRSMQSYETALKAGGARFVLSPQADFFRFFNSASGKTQNK